MSKTAQTQDQMAFVGGSWGDSEEENEEKKTTKRVLWLNLQMRTKNMLWRRGTSKSYSEEEVDLSGNRVMRREHSDSIGMIRMNENALDAEMQITSSENV
ncbi:hypothetical protein Tco_0550650 [Tanacetum coccineum]